MHAPRTTNLACTTHYSSAASSTRRGEFAKAKATSVTLLPVAVTEEVPIEEIWHFTEAHKVSWEEELWPSQSRPLLVADFGLPLKSEVCLMRSRASPLVLQERGEFSL